MNDVLRQEPVHGEADLVLARILRDTGASTEAESAYYRAIFGRWAPAQLASRQQARLELVALYEQAGDTARLRAALLELSAAFPGDRGLQLHAAQELLASGFADEAVGVLQGVVSRFADPGDALARLADTELHRGNHVGAYEAALRAVARAPGRRARRGPCATSPRACSRSTPRCRACRRRNGAGAPAGC